METIKQTIEIDLPISTVYNQWTQFEEFPLFMENITEVKQLDDTHLRWKANIAGKDVEWNAAIYEQKPDEIIAWRSTSGPENVGSVKFMPLTGNRTFVILKLSYEPKGLAGKLAEALGILSSHLESDLRRFKDFIEKRHKETGAWRGEVHSPASSKISVEHIK